MNPRARYLKYMLSHYVQLLYICKIIIKMSSISTYLISLQIVYAVYVQPEDFNIFYLDSLFTSYNLQLIKKKCFYYLGTIQELFYCNCMDHHFTKRPRSHR